MKSVYWMFGALCAAALCFLVWAPKRSEPVEELAHRLGEAWSDHHTIV